MYNTKFKFNKIFLATQLGIALLAGMGSSAYAQGLGGEEPDPDVISIINDTIDQDTYMHNDNGKNVLISGSNSGNQYGGQGSLVVQIEDGAFAGSPELTAPANGASSYNIVDTSASSTATANNIILETNQNTLTITESATVSGDVYGGYTAVTVGTGQALSGYIESTSYYIASAIANASTTAHANGAQLSANNNVLTVSEGSSIIGELYGGYAALTMQAKGAESANINASSGVESNMAKVELLAQNASISANNNTITVVKDATVKGNLTGGHAVFIAETGDAMGGKALSVANATNLMDISGTKILANNNAINFNGTLQNGNLYGGYTEFSISQGSAVNYYTGTGEVNYNFDNTDVQAKNNILTIGDNAQINSTSTSLYGGYLAYNTIGEIQQPKSYDLFTGNTLNFLAKDPISVNTIANFEYYNFTLDPILANTGLAMINANSVIFGTNVNNISTDATIDSKLRVVGIHSGNVLNVGDEFMLIRADNMSGQGEGSTTRGIAQQGISLLYDVETKVNSADNVVAATILDRGGNGNGEDGNSNNGGNGGGNGNGGGGSAARINPQLKALSEGYLSGLMLVTRGADLVVNGTLGTIRTQAQKNGFTPFIVTSAGYNRYNSGSHVKSKDFLVVGGVGLQHNGLTLGAFIEGGRGNYDSYNSFYTMPNVHGSGHSQYLGAGVVGRYEFDNSFYTEASLRTGKVRTKFGTQDIQNIATKEFANYRVSSTYVSAHLGTGYKLTLSETNNIDLSAKYLWSSVGGKSVKVAGDNIRFDRMNSNRVRVNATFNHQQSANLTFMAGLGYEHEFSGKANATTYNTYRIGTPSVKGGTGILSLGMRVTPTANKNLTLDFKAEGYAGKRKGGSLGFQVKYHF